MDLMTQHWGHLHAQPGLPEPLPNAEPPEQPEREDLAQLADATSMESPSSGLHAGVVSSAGAPMASSTPVDLEGMRNERETILRLDFVYVCLQVF